MKQQFHLYGQGTMIFSKHLILHQKWLPMIFIKKYNKNFAQDLNLDRKFMIKKYFNKREIK